MHFGFLFFQWLWSNENEETEETVRKLNHDWSNLMSTGYYMDLHKEDLNNDGKSQSLTLSWPSYLSYRN